MVLHVRGVQQFEYLNTQIQPFTNLSMLFRESFDGLGNSLKITTQEKTSDVLQLEYSACFEAKDTCYPAEENYWDISKTNGDPLVQYGVKVIPSYLYCAAVSCPAGVTDCKFVYYKPNDNKAVRECDSRSDWNVHLCLFD
jgi:hypothetical protein